MSVLRKATFFNPKLGSVTNKTYGEPSFEGGYSDSGNAICGSSTRSVSQSQASNFKLDYTADTWSTLPNVLASDSEQGNFSNKQFAWWGGRANTTLYRYQFETETTTNQGAQFSQTRSDADGVASNKFGHRVGGAGDQNSYRFNITTSVFTVSVLLGQSDNRWDSFTEGDYFYIFNRNQVSAEKIQLGTDTKSGMNSIPGSNSAKTCHSNDVIGVAWGGMGSEKQEYNFASGIWNNQATTGLASRGRFGLQSSTNIYAAGGDNETTTVYSTVDKSDMVSLTSSTINVLPSQRTNGVSGCATGHPLVS